MHDTAPASRRALRHAAAAALLTLACGGCMFSARQEDPAVTASVPVDYRLRHPIAVKEAARSLDLLVGTRRGSLTASQRAEVLAFAGAWRQEATGGVIIDLPAGTPNGPAAKGALREVRSLLARAGVPARAVAVRPYAPEDPVQMAALRISYPRMTAQAGPCGLWPDDLGPVADQKYSKNQPYWNHACASQRNLAAMVANPSDLVQPRSEAPVYAQRRTTVIDKYRAGQSTATVYPDANKGTINTDVGQ